MSTNNRLRSQLAATTKRSLGPVRPESWQPIARSFSSSVRISISLQGETVKRCQPVDKHLVDACQFNAAKIAPPWVRPLKQKTNLPASLQSPIRSKCSHCRKSPLKPRLSATWKLEMTHRSIGLPLFPDRRIYCQFTANKTRILVLFRAFECTISCCQIRVVMGSEPCIYAVLQSVGRTGFEPVKA